MTTREIAHRLPPELRAYLEPMFALPKAPLDLPLASEPCVGAWAAYAAEAGAGPVWPVLRARLPQLRFPIAEGISRELAYRAATRRGDLSLAPAAEDGLRLQHTEALGLRIHPTAAGEIAVLEPCGRADFETLLRAFAHRNEPVPIPRALGAAIIGEFNNWDRVAGLKAAWVADGGKAPDWPKYFCEHVVPSKPLYQDSFILLSDGPYSGLAAADAGLGDAAWRRASRTIRLEHEATHYLTKRLCGSMRNNVLDELIADYCGLVAAFGRFEAGLFCRFMPIGPDLPEAARAHGRIGVYRGTPPLDDATFALLQELLSDAAGRLEAGHDSVLAPLMGAGARGRATAVLALCALSLGDLAAPDAEVRIARAVASVRSALSDGGAA